MHYAPHSRWSVAWDVGSVVCWRAAFQPHLGINVGNTSCSRPGGRTRCDWRGGAARRASVRARPWRKLRGFVATIDYIDSLGCGAILAHEHALGERFLAGLPDAVELYGQPTMAGRVPTFCFNLPGRSPEEVATFLADHDVAVWHGDYYAVETMRHLGLDDGAVRAGVVHYNTEDEVDRLLAGLSELA